MKTLLFLPLFSACLGSFFQPGHGQISYREVGRITDAQKSLPSTGPGSSWSNPAALSETRLAHLQGGRSLSSEGTTSRHFSDLSATLPVSLATWLPLGLSLGLGWEAYDRGRDNSAVVFVESAFRPSLALAYPSAAERPFRLAAGLAFPIYTLNAFNAVKNASTAMDLGLLGLFEEKGVGRFRLGFTYHNLAEPKVRLPDRRGSFPLPGWWVASIGYATPGEWMRFHWEYYHEETEPPSEVPSNRSTAGMNAFEVEVKPIPWMGVKAEVTRAANRSSLGAVFYPQYGRWPIRFHLEANLGHNRLDVPGMRWLLGPHDDQGEGYLFGLSLGAGI